MGDEQPPSDHDAAPPKPAGARLRESQADYGTAAHDTHLFDECIARVTHELKAPVSVIAGSLDNLEQYVAALVRFSAAARPHLGAHPDLARLYDELALAYIASNAPALLKICRQGSRHLARLLQQLRRVAGVGSVVQPRSPIDVAHLLVECAAFVQADHPVRVEVERDIGNDDLTVLGSDALEEAFVNLLSNAFEAVRATDNPRVRISARRISGPGAAGTWVELRVCDNGPGVPARQHAEIFAPFFTTKAHSGGMGLGLALAKEIIDAHGGTLCVEDTPGGGATFVLRLPAQGA